MQHFTYPRFDFHRSETQWMTAIARCQATAPPKGTRSYVWSPPATSAARPPASR